MSSTLLEIMDAIATQLETELGTEVDGLQVHGRLVISPTPPCLDVYPGDPFAEQTSYGAANRQALFTIRARVSTADSDAGQELLLDLMDPHGNSSVVGALASDRTLNGTVQDSVVEGPSGFIVYADPGATSGQNLLGAQWLARVIL